MHYDSLRKSKEKNRKLFKKIVAEDFPNLKSEMDIQIQET